MIFLPGNKEWAALEKGGDKREDTENDALKGEIVRGRSCDGDIWHYSLWSGKVWYKTENK